jgi:hypothetical protein
MQANARTPAPLAGSRTRSALGLAERHEGTPGHGQTPPEQEWLYGCPPFLNYARSGDRCRDELARASVIQLGAASREVAKTGAEDTLEVPLP